MTMAAYRHYLAVALTAAVVVAVFAALHAPSRHDNIALVAKTHQPEPSAAYPQVW